MIDAYKSLIEAINHGGLDNNVKVTIKWVNSESIEDQNLNLTNFFKVLNVAYKDSNMSFAVSNHNPFLDLEDL